jgi:hypothetical protein
LELKTPGTADTPPALISAWNADTVNPTFGANISVASNQISSALSNGAWQTVSVTATISTTTQNIIVAIWTDSAAAAESMTFFSDMGLYIGSQVRVFSPPNFAQELLRCYRYFYKNQFHNVTGPTLNSYAGGSQPYPVEMLKVPTLAFTDAIGNASKVTTFSSGNNVGVSSGGIAGDSKALIVDIAVVTGFINWFTILFTADADIY